MRGAPVCVGVHNTAGDVRLPLTVLPGVQCATGSPTTLRRMTGHGRRGIRAWTRRLAFGDWWRICGCAPVDQDTRMIEQGLRCLFECCAQQVGAFCVALRPPACAIFLAEKPLLSHCAARRRVTAALGGRSYSYYSNEPEHSREYHSGACCAEQRVRLMRRRSLTLAAELQERISVLDISA